MPNTAEDQKPPSRGKPKRSRMFGGMFRQRDPEKEKLEKEFLSTYASAFGSMPDMTQMERRERGVVRSVLVPLAGIALLACAMLYVGYRIFNQSSSYVGQNVQMDIAGPFEAEIGSEISYTLTLTNQDTIDLQQVYLQVTYPSGFVFTEASQLPVDPDNTQWDFAVLEPRERRTLTVKGQLWGEEDTLAELVAELTFTPRNFLLHLEERRMHVTRLRGSVFDFTVDYPPQVLVGEEATYQVAFNHEVGDLALSAARLVVELPENFKVLQSVPELEGSGMVRYWNVAQSATSFAPKLTGIYTEKKTASEGVAANTTPDPNALVFYAEVRTGDMEPLVTSRKMVVPDIVVGDILASVIIKGSHTTLAANFGDVLPVSIVVRNKGESVVENVRLTFAEAPTDGATPSLVSWDAIDAGAGGNLGEVSIFWDQDAVDNFTRMLPDDEKTLDVTLPIVSWLAYKELEDAGSIPRSWQPRVVVRVIGTYISAEGTREQTFESNPVTLALSTPLNVFVQARYFNDDNIAVGTGPLPPRVGETTTYHVIWSVETFLNDLNDLTMRTVLPESVSFVAPVDIAAGDVEFNPVSRQVAWRLNALPASIKRSTVAFTVSVTPATQDANTLLTLTGETTLAAKDAATKAAIEYTFSPLTSDLEGDPAVSGKGIVEAAP